MILQYITYSQLERGESITLQCVDQPNMMATVWQDTKVVTATSTNAQPLPHHEVTRRMKTVEKMYSHALKILRCIINIWVVLTETINCVNITT